jgi:hypothetical protein
VLGLGVAVSGAVLSVAFAVVSAARVSRLAPPRRAELEASLRRGDDGALDRAVAAAFPEALPELAAARQAPERRAAAAAALDEQLGDLDRELSASHAGAKGTVRIALLTAGFGAVLELARDLSTGQGFVNAMTAAGAGAIAAVLSLELGRRSERKAEMLRREWDALAALVAARSGLLRAGEAERTEQPGHAELPRDRPSHRPGQRRSRGRGRTR